MSKLEYVDIPWTASPGLNSARSLRRVRCVDLDLDIWECEDVERLAVEGDASFVDAEILDENGTVIGVMEAMGNGAGANVPLVKRVALRKDGVSLPLRAA